MIAYRLMGRAFLRHAVVPVLCYCALIVAFLTAAVFSVTDLVQRHQRVGETAEILSHFEHPKRLGSPAPGQVAGDDPQGSPFLQGPTVTVASAALLQRVTSAITHAGGNLVSSGVEPQDSQSADGFVRITATCEIEHEALQQLLYDIEAGMPFLFVDQFAAEVPSSAKDGERMRVMLKVSGLWAGAKAQ